MLRRMGWEEGKGLGRLAQGVKEPVSMKRKGGGGGRPVMWRVRGSAVAALMRAAAVVLATALPDQ